MEDNRRSMVLASFAADALALGVHWVYNTRVIDKKFGRVETYLDPLTSYHPGKKKGDFTHYGDQTLVLLQSAAEDGGFDPDGFARRWRTFFKESTTYLDKAAKTTLENMEAGQGPDQGGSTSDDLGGACRIAPLVYALHQDMDALVAAARAQTIMSHNNLLVAEAAEFFARVAAKALNGQSPAGVMVQTAEEMKASEELKEGLDMGQASADGDTRQVIADFGQACATSMAFPGAIHLIAKYEGDLKEALVENAMAGGDSSARGMLAGMVIGAWRGESAIPRVWLDELNARDRIERLLERLGKCK
ncbi:MAG: ADP-ribosylglycohydrolase family protein [Desulfobacterales bacterium]|nr:ADP-ribosylglycohydrolase family protein [Desulfobacterales bacterium]